MSKEKCEELFRALHSLLDDVTNPNVRDLEAEAQAESSSQRADASAKEKAKDQKKKLRTLILTGQKFRFIHFPSLRCLLGLAFLRS
jgi:hypothetical protein